MLSVREAESAYLSDARQRARDNGATHCTDAELLALLIRKHKGYAHVLARTLLLRFGSLRNVLTASDAELQAAGLHEQDCTTLRAAMELTRRHYRELMQQGDALADPRLMREYVRMRLRDLPHEVFCCVHLNNRNRVLAFVELFRGTIDGAAVHPREVVKDALRLGAAAVILVHNHPSGVAEPSQADEFITRRLKEALMLVDIRVVDHLIVGDSSCESFAERGLL